MFIYQAINKINNKSYIGFTRKDLKFRIKAHSRGSTTKFGRAINKYGHENFEWIILDSSAKNLEELKQLEIDYIAKLKPEYNGTLGGDGIVPTKEVIIKRSNSHRGFRHSEKSIELIRKRTKEEMSKKDHPFLNKKHKQETKDKISKKLKGRKLTEQHKKNISLGTKKKENE